MKNKKQEPVKQNPVKQNTESTIYFNEEGYKDLCSRIDELEAAFKRVSSADYEMPDLSSEEYTYGGDFVTMRDELQVIHTEIEKLKEMKARVVKIGKHNNEGFVDIDDVVLLSLDDGTGVQEATVQVVAGTFDINSEIRQASINSPLGKAIFGKPYGSTTTYEVNIRGNVRKFDVIILSKVNQKNR